MTQLSQENIEVQNIHLQAPPITKTQLIKKIWSIPFITFGGPMSHVGVFRQIFVEDLKTISNDKFMQLFTLCQSLPGPTSTQLVISLSMYSTFSWIGGLIAFLIFSSPTFLVMSLCGLFLRHFDDVQIMQQILLGFRIISVAIILQAFWKLSQKYRNQSRMVLLFTCCMVIYYFNQTPITIMTLFLIGGIYNIITDKSSPPQDKEYLNPNRFLSFPYGFKNVFLFIFGLVFAFSIDFNKRQHIFLSLWSTFFKIGSLVIGGGHVILPLMLTQLQPYHIFKEDHYWNGFSIISFMPGPMFNISAYIGTLSTNHFFGGVVAFLGLYIPCFLFISFALPFWYKYRKYSKIQKFLHGVCCVSVGLILATCIILYTKVTKDKEQQSLFYTLLIIGSYYLLHKNWSIVYVLVIGQNCYITYAILKAIINKIIGEPEY